MNYFQFHIGDYAKHTAHLTPLEDLAYRRLLEFCYITEAPIPNDIPLVSRRLRLASEHIESVLKEFFFLTETGWVNSRATKEIAAYQAFLAKQKANGIKGGRPPNNPEKPKPIPSLSQTEPKITLTTNQEPLTTNQKPVTNGRARATRLPTSFEPDRQFAMAEGIGDIDREFDKFRDYWNAQPGSKGTKLDWPGTWRNWCRNANKSIRGSPGHFNKQEALEASNRAVVQRLLAKEAQHAQP